VNPDSAEFRPVDDEFTPPRTRDRYWLHILLLLIAFATTMWAGAAFAWSFDQNRPASVDEFIPTLSPAFPLAAGLAYSLTLLTILMAHEMGHYVACRYYGVDASLPYFLGVPTLIGTFGAFIRIRDPISTRKELFDIGVAGPLAGFAFLVPALAIGLAYSRIVPGIAEAGEVSFGAPLLLRLLEWLIFPGVPATDIALHPVARAAWVGMLATALNLMPIGQLDGGHIVYAIFPAWHKRLTLIFIICLVPFGLIFSWTWLFWAAVLFFVARKHPRIYDNESAGPGRAKIGVLALVIFVLCFSPAPIRI